MAIKGKRIAWVTGGGSGIGFAGAEALAADGWIFAISGRRPEVLAGAVNRIGDKTGIEVDVVPVDVARRQGRSEIHNGEARAERSARQQRRAQCT